MRDAVFSFESHLGLNRHQVANHIDRLGNDEARRTISRRSVLGAFAVASLWSSAGSKAIAETRFKRLAILSGFIDEADARHRTGAMIRALTTHGWLPGKTISIEYHQSNNIPTIKLLARKLVASKPDAIFVTPGYVLPIVLEHTHTIPIVFANAAGPVEQGWIRSIAEPGGNATGFTSFEYSIGGQWLSLLKEAQPNMSRALVLGFDGMFTAKRLWESIEKAGKSLGGDASYVSVRSFADVRRAIETFDNARGAGLICLPHGSLFTSNAARIADIALRRGMLSIYGFRTFADRGGLISYGNLESDAFHRAGRYVDRILRGENPGRLPIQNPVAFELVLNLKTAKALGINFPETLQARATTVIE